MASIHREIRNGQTYYRLQFYDKHNARRSIRLGRINKKDADAIRVKVEALVSASVSGGPLDSQTSQWAANLGDDLTGKLADAGLIERNHRATLSEFLTNYIDGRKTDAGESTVTNFRQLQRSLQAFFGPDRDLRTISEGDADDWRRQLVPQFAEATISKLVKRARQVFKAATRKRVCETNPFLGLKGGSEQNDGRKHFVSHQVTEKALQAAPDAEWRLIIALLATEAYGRPARFSGCGGRISTGRGSGSRSPPPRRRSRASPGGRCRSSPSWSPTWRTLSRRPPKERPTSLPGIANGTRT